MQPTDSEFMKLAIDLSQEGMDKGAGGPFGTVIVKDGQVIATGVNQVTSTNDPTAHSEMVAIRAACEKLGTYDLSGCALYASCEPCPMCLGAIYWARIDRVYYAGTREDAARIGFDDAHIYDELAKRPHERDITFTQIGRDTALDIFAAWEAKPDKIMY